MILNGSVEVQVEGQDAVTLHLGESFGVQPTNETYYHKGIMKTRVDDCQVCGGNDEYTWGKFGVSLRVNELRFCDISLDVG